MRHFLLGLFFVLSGAYWSPSSASTAAYCILGQYNLFHCYSASAVRPDDADRKANELCEHDNLGPCIQATPPFSHQCVTVAHANNNGTLFHALGDTVTQAHNILRCPLGVTCYFDFDKCDVDQPASQLDHALDFLGDPAYWQTVIWKIVVEGIWNGIGIGLGILLVGCAFWKRAPIVNLLIHGNLPYKLPVYGEDIQCLFKRTQRVNWYGRVIFGIVANFAMTHQQLIDIRKYWLGRVVAFDSLRRQRQNELARMHFQLAAAAKSDAYDKKNFWSRRWATIRTLLRRLFWVFAAAFRLLLSVFFIRVNIAKLVRGTVVESSDLTLILQAKEAIEESAQYLKEYLETANTFDGRDEVI